jgi:hypothetical protein
MQHCWLLDIALKGDAVFLKKHYQGGASAIEFKPEITAFCAVLIWQIQRRRFINVTSFKNE